MPRILVVAELKAASKDAADQIAEKLIGVSKYSKANEPGVNKYMICRPADPSEMNNVWAIEEYADKETLDTHMVSEPVKNLISFMSTEPVLAGAPTIHQLSYLSEMDFTKSAASDLTDPLIVFATINFSSGKREGTLAQWENNLRSSKDESGTLVYSFAQADEQPDTLFTVEVYESEAFLTDVHIPSAAVQQTITHTKDVRENLTVVKLKLRGGYVHKKS